MSTLACRRRRAAARSPVSTASDAGASAPTLADDSVTSTTFTSDQATDTGEGDAAPFARSPYGEGSHVGDEPPEGFTIKGNERSMKYHVEGNAGYARTIADVWFDSEEAALRAGFTKAQR